MRKTLITLAVLLTLPALAFNDPTMRIARLNFADLNAPLAGSVRYCLDCAATAPCTGGGTGAFAYRVGSTWNCTNGSSGVATPVSVANGGTGQTTYTKGDLLAAPGGATLNKLAVGSDAQVLTADAASANGVKWAAAAGGASFPLLAPDGTVGAPSYSFTNSATTGMYSNAANSVAIAASGVNAITASNAAVAVPVGLFTIGFQATTAGSLRFANASGPFLLTLTATTAAGGSRTVNLDWSAVSATRQLKFANFNMDFSLLGNPFGTNMALTTPTISGLITGGSTPAVSNTSANSCGTTAATIIGNDSTGVITVGATAGTNCTITFTVAAPTRRQCTVTNETTANLSRSTFLTTTTSTVEGTFVAGDNISYVCSVF